MREFIGGMLLTLLVAGVAVAALLYRRGSRGKGSGQRQPNPDEEWTRLTGELAHEIKNPLSTIKVNLKLARESLDDIDLTDPGRVLWDQCRHKLGSASRKITVIQKEADRLEQILDGFLKYVHRPELQLATVDVNELVSDMIDFFSPQAHSRALMVRHSLADEPLMCRVDPGAVKQVLLNLFINAQQAMDTGAELIIRTSRNGERAAIQISDTGKGIPPERLPTIFRPYQSSGSGGTGLGLATAKKIIEAHKGTISVHSELGKGTSFTIELPLAPVDPKPNEQTAE